MYSLQEYKAFILVFIAAVVSAARLWQHKQFYPTGFLSQFKKKKNHLIVLFFVSGGRSMKG